MLTRVVLVVALSSLAFLAVGCGGHTAMHSTPKVPTASKTEASSASSSQHGFLAIATNGALFIQWTRTANAVQGTLSEVYTSLSDPTQAQSASHSFTGVISGSSVTLTLDSGDNWNGTLNGSHVTLSYTSSDGSLQTFDFGPASVADYNAAVGNVQASSGQAQTKKAQAAATQQADQQVDGDANAVASDLSNIRSGLASLTSHLASVPADITQMRQDLATESSDLRKVLTDSAANVCNDNYQVSGTDAYQVTGTDDYQITGTDEYDISTDFSTVRDALSQAPSDMSKLVRDSALARGYLPAGAPTKQAVATATQQARTAVALAQAKWNGDLATVKQLDAKANSYGAQADAACNRAGG